MYYPASGNESGSSEAAKIFPCTRVAVARDRFHDTNSAGPPNRCESASSCSKNRAPFGPTNPLCGRCVSSNYTEIDGHCVCELRLLTYITHSHRLLTRFVCRLSVGRRWPRRPGPGAELGVRAGDPCAGPRDQRLDQEWVLGRSARTSLTIVSVAVFLFWVQTLMIMLSGAHSAFGWSVDKLESRSFSTCAVLFLRLKVFNFAPQQAAGAVCVMPQTPYEQLGVSGVFPLVFIGLLGVSLVVHRLYQYLRAGAVLPPLDLVPWIRTLVVLGLSCYTQVTSSVLLYMQCVNVGTQRVVFSVPAIDCSPGNTKYIGWLVIAVLLLIVFVAGLPVAVLVFLCRNREHIERGEKFAVALGPLFEVRARLLLLFLLKSKTHYW